MKTIVPFSASLVALFACLIAMSTGGAANRDAVIAVRNLRRLRVGMTHEQVMDAYGYPLDTIALGGWMTNTAFSRSYFVRWSQPRIRLHLVYRPSNPPTLSSAWVGVDSEPVARME